MRILRARWIVPVAAPPIEGGAIAVCDGRIIGLGSPADMPAGDQLDFGDAILLPGFVNAHAHLELTGLRGLLPPLPLFEWFDRLLELHLSGQLVLRGRAAVSAGAAESLAAGVTCVGDISRTGLHVDALATCPIRKVYFVECISGGRLGPHDANSLAAAVEAVMCRAEPDRLRIGLAPHAPYSVTPRDQAGIADLARRLGLPVTMHVLETPEERDWLARRTGPVSGFLNRHGLDRVDHGPAAGAFEMLERAGLLAAAPLLAHVNYPDDREIERLASSGASVAFCPRAHRFFGHDPHRWSDMLAAGVNVCLGTDSLGSNETLSILDEVRFLRQNEKNVEPRDLLEMATSRGARALGFDDQIGSLTVGKLADFVVMPCEPRSKDPVRQIVDGDAAVAQVWISGRRVWPVGDRST